MQNPFIPLIFLGLMSGCSVPTVDDVLWQCSQPDDCGEGYVCQASAGLCRPLDEGGRNGVFADRVVFGAVLPLSKGPTGAAIAWQQGLRAAFERINTQGGLHGRRLEVEIRDDGYDAETALAALTDLSGRRQVLGILGGFGNHVSAVVGKTLEEQRMLLVGRSGNADLGGDARYLFGVGVGDAAETRWLVDRLTGPLGVLPDNIAVVVQATANGQAMDSQGRSILEGVQAAGIATPGVGLVPAARVEVSTAVAGIRAWMLDSARRVGPDGRVQVAIVLGIEASAAAAFMADLTTAIASTERLAPPRWAATSAAGATELIRTLALLDGPAPTCGSGVLVSLAVPSWEGTDPAAADYRTDLAASESLAVPGDSSFEGYLTGRLLAIALDAQGRETAAEVFIDALESTQGALRAAKAPRFGFATDSHRAVTTVTGAEIDPDCTLRILP